MAGAAGPPGLGGYFFNGGEALSIDLLRIAHLSNRLFEPPHGLTLAGQPSGEKNENWTIFYLTPSKPAMLERLFGAPEVCLKPASSTYPKIS